MSLRVCIPDYLPPGLNSLLNTHWAVRAKQKERLERSLKGLATEPGLPLKGDLRARMIRCRRAGPPMDEDNAYSSFKYIGDALQKLGFIENDRQIKELVVEQRRGPERKTLLEVDQLDQE